MTPFDEWLDARDGPSLAAAWRALAPTTLDRKPALIADLGILGCYRTGHATVQLAGEWLGVPREQVEWLAATSDTIERANAPAPLFAIGRSVAFSYLEHEVEERDCYEQWDLRELRVGQRGVQRLHVAWGRSDGTREDTGEGGRGTVVRIYDRQLRIGVCVPLISSKVSLIGDVDIDRVFAALDVFDFSSGFLVRGWRYDVEMVRGVVALLATELDAHYDQSASWPGAVLRASEWATVSRHASGAHAVDVEQRPNEGAIEARLEGLPWGHELVVSVRFTAEGGYVHCNVRLPATAAMRMAGRLKAIERTGSATD